MKLICKLFGVLIILIGLVLFIKPDFFFNWLEANIGTTSLYIVAIVFRLAFGILFIMAAKQSRFPTGIKILGFVAVLAAVIFLFMGQNNFYELFSPLLTNFKAFAPVSALVAIAIGAFVVYAFLEEKANTQLEA